MAEEMSLRLPAHILRSNFLANAIQAFRPFLITVPTVQILSMRSSENNAKIICACPVQSRALRPIFYKIPEMPKNSPSCDRSRCKQKPFRPLLCRI